MRRSEPIFNVPLPVVILVALCVGVHVLRQTMSLSENVWWTQALAFVPARYGEDGTDIPGGALARVTSVVTHLFVHGDVMHLGVNSAWLLAFGTPVARRTGALRFIVLFFLCGAAGAALYVALNGFVPTLLIGASGAISGLMGAAFRFLFSSLEAGPAAFADATRYLPLASLGETLRDRRVVGSVAVWAVFNVLLALGAAGLTDAGGIAWEAHLGGFALGFLVYGFFDRPPPAPLFEDIPQWEDDARA